MRLFSALKNAVGFVVLSPVYCVSTLFQFSRFILNNKTLFLMTVATLTQNSVANAAGCNPPAGSYLNTCGVTGSNYRSSDSNLSRIRMCKFDISCKQLDGSNRNSTIYAQESMTDCFKFFENCNGWLRVRSENQRVCVNKDAIDREADLAKMEL